MDRPDDLVFGKLSVPQSVPGMDVAVVDVAHLPGLVIFVHGVNSDGEWYDTAERGLVKGLNERMGLSRAAGGEGVLRAAEYAKDLMPDGTLNRNLSGKTFITETGRSPVIRFRWGYKAAGADGTPGSLDEVVVYGSKIYLNELDAWGGGPFQNGTTALPYMWGEGFDDRVFWWIYANMLPVDGREIYASPPRAYFAHAAHRLKELIKAIRSKQADCPITVVCHSQGNMVTLAAAFLGESEQAVADTYVLCNPPYSLESLGLDKLVNEDSKSATGQSGGVTTFARKETFKRFLRIVKERAGRDQPLDLINRYHAFRDPSTDERVFSVGPFPVDVKAPLGAGVDRDNRGRVFLNCNPHDQVIGVSPVQGIGWRGVSQAQLDEIGAEGVFHQRVWAMPGKSQTPPFAVGAPQWTEKAYRYLDDNHDPEQFWHPLPPIARYKILSHSGQGPLGGLATVLFGPILWLATGVLRFRINDDPKKDWAVPITAPALRVPHAPRSMRYGEDGDFDQARDPARDALSRKDGAGEPVDARSDDAFGASGKGTVETEAALRYEIDARLRRERRDAERRETEFSVADRREAVRRMLDENPNATDHSTILTHEDNVAKVLAYDVAVGWVNPSRITAKDLSMFRQFASWMLLDFIADELPAAAPFVDYWLRGFYMKLQLQHTYTMQHMSANTQIVDVRERSLGGVLRG